MLEWIEKRTKSAYLRMLESECIRLREENRQLVNSLLASHGMQQLESPKTPQQMQPIKRMRWEDYRRKMERRFRAPRPAPEAPQAANGNQPE